MSRKAKPPSYLKHQGADGKLRARCRIHGVWHSLGDYGSQESFQKFERFRAEWFVMQSSGRAPAGPGGRTVQEIAKAFMDHAAQHYRRPDGTQTSEVQWFRSSIKDLCELYGPTPAREFGPLGLKAVRQRMIARGWERKPPWP